MNLQNIKPSRNPETKQLHTKQKVWQIFLPFFVATVLILTMGIFASLSTTSDGGGPHVWAEISEIWILIPTILVSLVLLIFLVIGNIGIAKAIHYLPGIGLQVQTFIYKAAVAIRTYADKTVSPLISYHQARTALGALFKRKSTGT